MRPSPWPNTPQGRSARRRALRSRAHRSERCLAHWETEGHRKPSQSWSFAVKQGSTRGHVVRPSFGWAGGRGSHHPGRKPGVRVIRESSVSQGARVVCWLQKSERRIFPARAERAERRAESPQGSLTRRPSLTRKADSRWVKGCGASACKRTVSASKPASAARHEDRADGRRPGSGVAEALNKPKQRRA
jgi:hypothetical protein